MGVMEGGAEKATVMGSDSGAQVHWSPLVMVVGLEASSQATLCLVISRVWHRTGGEGKYGPSVGLAVNQASPWVIWERRRQLWTQQLIAKPSHRHTLERFLVRAVWVLVVKPATSCQVRGPVLAVVAGLVVETNIARLAAMNMAKDPVPAGNEVGTGLLPWCVEAGTVADGSVGVGHGARGQCVAVSRFRKESEKPQ